MWALIDELKGPDADAAWRTFVDRYRPFVRGLLLRVVRRADWTKAAEDEFWGYIYISDAVRRADRGRRFRPFLAGIVHHFAQSWLRKLPREHAVEELDATAPALPDAGDAEMAAWSHNVIALALAALTAESPAMAKAVQGFYALGTAAGAAEQNASQLAQALGCTTTNVYQLLSRGRRRLRDLIELEVLAGCADASDLKEELAVFLASACTLHPGLFADGAGETSSPAS